MSSSYYVSYGGEVDEYCYYEEYDGDDGVDGSDGGGAGSNGGAVGEGAVCSDALGGSAYA